MRKLAFKRGKLPKQQILVATVLGVAVGIYTWDPALKEYHRKRLEREEKIEKDGKSEQNTLNKDN